MSSYEEKVISLLKKGKYKFEREKRFNDLKGGRYRYDFYIHGARPILLEIQGEQHYRYIPKFYRTRAEFESAKERDRRKISYALANQIPLYCIPYWELDNIAAASQLFDERFCAKNRWKNDLDWQKHKKFDKPSKILVQ